MTIKLLTGAAISIAGAHNKAAEARGSLIREIERAMLALK